MSGSGRWVRPSPPNLRKFLILENLGWDLSWQILDSKGNWSLQRRCSRLGESSAFHRNWLGVRFHLGKGSAKGDFRVDIRERIDRNFQESWCAWIFP
jgi:hypothetical protein